MLKRGIDVHFVADFLLVNVLARAVCRRRHVHGYRRRAEHVRQQAGSVLERGQGVLPVLCRFCASCESVLNAGVKLRKVNTRLTNREQKVIG